MALRSGPVLLLLLLLAAGPRAQELCGDLDLDGDVDAADALILRNELAASAPMTLDQALACDVIDELREPGLEPDPADLAGRCSMSDADVMIRTGEALLPGPAQSCALGSSADCCGAHAGVGCNASDTVQCVCASDPSCCTVDWDADCAALACGTGCAPACTAPEDLYCAGACRDTDTDLGHCGACNTPCSLPNASEVCSAGTCQLVACDVGFCDLDGVAADGCEYSPSGSPSCPGSLLGSVIGDVADLPFSTSSPRELIFRVQVTEAVAVGGADLTARVGLSGPAGSDYDLYVRCASCIGASKASATPGTSTETIDIGRNDGPGDSSFELVIEVRWASGAACAQWTLEIEGGVATGDRACD